MLNFIQAEFLKLKNSHIFLLTALVALFPALLVFLMGLAKVPGFGCTFGSFFELTFYFFILILGIILFSIVISYLIGREFNEHTLKTVITAPTSKTKFLVGKYLMFLIWIIILMIISFLSTLIVCVILGASGFSLNLVFGEFCKFIFAGFLIFLTMSPFIFLVMVINSMVPAIIVGAMVTVANLLVQNLSIAPYFPWTVPYVLISGDIAGLDCPSYIPYLVIAITFIVGFAISYLFFVKRDITL